MWLSGAGSKANKFGQSEKWQHLSVLCKPFHSWAFKSTHKKTEQNQTGSDTAQISDFAQTQGLVSKKVWQNSTSKYFFPFKLGGPPSKPVIWH